MTERPVGNDVDLGGRFHELAQVCRSRAPFYARLADAIGDDPATSRLLLHAPAHQRMPVLLFACVHWLLLTEPGHELQRFYPNLADEPDRSDPYPTFRAFCARHEPRLAGLLASRSTQTNEVGRCAFFLPPLGLVADEVGELSLVDVGASGGLNLLLDRYEYRYVPGGAVGGPSPVVLECGTTGAVPVPSAMPVIGARVGIDRSPIDLRDRAAASWLEACVWPDQRDRFRRLHEAIELGRASPPEVRAGDAIAELARAVHDVGTAGHPVVMNSWVLNYFTPGERVAYLDELDRIGAQQDLSWIYAEAPGLIGGLPVPTDVSIQDLTVVTLARWRGGRRDMQHLATSHPHGFWLHWH